MFAPGTLHARPPATRPWNGAPRGDCPAVGGQEEDHSRSARGRVAYCIASPRSRTGEEGRDGTVSDDGRKTSKSMKRSTERILTTHVGSLSRPDALVPILTAKDRGQPYDREAYARLVREAVGDVVRRQT